MTTLTSRTSRGSHAASQSAAVNRTGSHRTGAPGRSTQRTRSAAANRAIERRRRRLAAQAATEANAHAQAERGLTRVRFADSTTHSDGVLTRLMRSPDRIRRRVPFVALVMVIFAVGIGTTLFLSTQSAQESFELSKQRDRNQALSDLQASLQKDVAAGEAAPVIAQKAASFGMVPATNVPILVSGPHGTKPRVIGTPTPAKPAGPMPKPAVPAPTANPTAAPPVASTPQASEQSEQSVAPAPHAPSDVLPPQIPASLP